MTRHDLHSKPPGGYFTLRQANPARFKKLYTQSYCALHVLGGSKLIFREDGSQLRIKTGDMVLFRSGESLTFENQPSQDSPYRAEGISFRPDLVEEVSVMFADLQKIGSDDHRSLPCEAECLTAYRAAVDAILADNLPASIKMHRLKEVLIWMAQAGIRLITEQAPQLKKDVRQIILTDIEHRWKASDIAENLHMSEPTLRRRLAREETSFSDILQDARLSHALDMLMCTDVPITEVSYAAGFGSPSSFARKFRERFELTPSDVRNPSTSPDRIGTVSDRDGKAA